MDLMNFLNENFWAVATMISLLTIPITTAINVKFTFKNAWKQVVAWVVSIALTTGVYFCNLATFNDPVWLSIPLTGIVCGLSANGIYDIPTIKSGINKWLTNLIVKQ